MLTYVVAAAAGSIGSADGGCGDGGVGGACGGFPFRDPPFQVSLLGVLNGFPYLRSTTNVRHCWEFARQHTSRIRALCRQPREDADVQVLYRSVNKTIVICALTPSNILLLNGIARPSTLSVRQRSTPSHRHPHFQRLCWQSIHSALWVLG